MKKVIAIFFGGLIAMQIVAKLLIIGLFVFNQSFFVQQFCENKSKPNLHCNGKCYLKKQLQAESNATNENTKSQQLLQIIELPIFIQNTIAPQAFYSNVQLPVFYFNQYKNNYSFLFSAILFHPPTA